MTALASRLAIGLNAVEELPNAPEDFARIAAPVTVVRGGATDPMHQRLAEIVAGLIPGATLIDVPGAGHMLTLTHGEAVVELLAEE